MNKNCRSISILFIGNSFNYYHSLPKLIAHFAKMSGLGNLAAEGVFRGSATLKMLWQDGKALKKIRSKKWDYVVLQERGRLGGIIKHGVVHVGKPQAFIEYATRFDKEIKKFGATTILYCPPSFLGVGLLGDVKKLHAAYTALARKLHVAMIPSGIAFLLASKKRPKMNLYERDGHHPNPLGMYLIACLFYRKLFHKKADVLPLESYLSRSEKLPKNPKIVKVSRADARFFWSVANQIK
jgi:hypothetical protein